MNPKPIAATLENFDCKRNRLAVEGQDSLNGAEDLDSYLELLVEILGTLADQHMERQKIREITFVN